MEQELAPAREWVRERVPERVPVPEQVPVPALVRGPVLVLVREPVLVPAVERRMTVGGYRRRHHRRQTR